MRPATKALALAAPLAAPLAAIVLLPGGAWAAGTMPQLVPEDMAPQLVWLAIIFAVLYGLMSAVAVPRIAATLQARDAKISGDLAAAEKANEDARALIEAYNQRLTTARPRRPTRTPAR
jgi:F-type H+-transporting ATPase subunit b